MFRSKDQQLNNIYRGLIGSKLKQIFRQFLQKLQEKQIKAEQLHINFNDVAMKQGHNFIGRIHNETKKIVGVAMYFQYHEEDSCWNVFVGQLNKNGSTNGSCITMCVKSQIKKLDESNHRETLDKTKHKMSPQIAQFLSSLPLPKQTEYNAIYIPSQEKQQGFIYEKKASSEKEFKGSLTKKNNLEYEKNNGVLEEKYDKKIQLKYEGKFKNDKFDGKGTLNVYGQYIYVGKFDQHHKDGFGTQRDYIRNTLYTGMWNSNEKQGYGQLIYAYNSNNIEDKKILKGYWEKGKVIDGKAVLVDHFGKFVQSYQSRGFKLF